MPIKYDKLMNLLKEKGYTTYRIRKENIISQSALQKIRTGVGDIEEQYQSYVKCLNVNPAI